MSHARGRVKRLPRTMRMGPRHSSSGSLHDDALDPRVEDATREWIEIADAAAQVVIGALRSGVARR